MHTLDDSYLQCYYWFGSYLLMHFSECYHALQLNDILYLSVSLVQMETEKSLSFSPSSILQSELKVKHDFNKY